MDVVTGVVGRTVCGHARASVNGKNQKTKIVHYPIISPKYRRTRPELSVKLGKHSEDAHCPPEEHPVLVDIRSYSLKPTRPHQVLQKGLTCGEYHPVLQFTRRQVRNRWSSLEILDDDIKLMFGIQGRPSFLNLTPRPKPPSDFIQRRCCNTSQITSKLIQNLLIEAAAGNTARDEEDTAKLMCLDFYRTPEKVTGCVVSVNGTDDEVKRLLMENVELKRFLVVLEEQFADREVHKVTQGYRDVTIAKKIFITKPIKDRINLIQ
ncbi:hypothetical protein HYC85_029940 [Camellia sinensis]|uniref:Uncharacterized protein n=1 Tax=Camellia sinensis TaxID=4442 RepID=A0A7J7FZH6_CAMSI|nr:hypothetical protein HYC85_029940 [Camellia sinensis]